MISAQQLFLERIVFSKSALYLSLFGTFTVLSPRQQITSTPYSIRSSDSAKLESIAASGFIQNTTVQQAATNFNISGAGTANIFDAATQYNIGGSRVLSATGANLFAGITAGAAEHWLTPAKLSSFMSKQ